MLALAEILALIILNALVHTAFTRWKRTGRTQRAKRPARTRLSHHYPLHPSPLQLAPGPEHAHIRPAGIDW
jgi:hypothetical protein